MWMKIECGAYFVAEPPLARQHFFQVVCGCPKGLLDAENFGKLFLSFLPTAPVNAGLPAQQRTFLRGKLAAQPRTQSLFTSW